VTLGAEKEQGSTNSQESYHPLREILKREKKSVIKEVRKIDTERDRWWAYALKGMVSIAFGAVLMIWPEESLLFLIIAFGIQALVKGLIGLVHATSLAVKKERWILVLCESIVGVLLGIALVVQPHATLKAMLVLVGIWMIATGIIHLATARRDPSASMRGLMGTEGFLSVIIGAIFVVVPIEAVSLAHMLMAIQALALGMIFIIAGAFMLFKSRRLKAEDASTTIPSSEDVFQE
jgi:uncharacterized membrane protein HdeD (DUF308 family)